MNKKQQARLNSLLPGGIPKWIRVYDSGPDGAMDRYTVVYTALKTGVFPYLGMNASPFAPQGIGQHGETLGMPCDRPTSSHLGKRIKFTDLPADCQKAVLIDYRELWDLPEPAEAPPDDTSTLSTD